MERPSGPGVDLGRLYRHRFSEDERTAKAKIWEVIVREFFQSFIRPEDVVLDVGCGYGEFLNHVRSGRRIGVDLNPDARQHLAAGVELHVGDVRDLSFLEDGTVDVVFTSNLLEHLPEKKDVERLFREILRVLKPGGQVIAMGPNVRYLPGAYWDFWDHVTPITDRSLTELLGTLGFAIEACHPRFLPYTTQSGLPQGAWLVSLYLKLPVAWRLFGRQFLIRARKPR